MYHAMRWTLEKAKRQLDLIASRVYRRSSPLPPFRFCALAGPLSTPAVQPGDADGDWQEIKAGDYWGGSQLNYVLRAWFTIPAGWDPTLPVALYLPLGDSRDFSHPESLAYVDGQPYAASDRHQAHPRRRGRAASRRRVRDGAAVSQSGRAQVGWDRQRAGGFEPIAVEPEHDVRRTAQPVPRPRQPRIRAVCRAR